MRRATYPCGHTHVGLAIPIVCPACQADRVLAEVLATMDAVNARVRQGYPRAVLGLPDGGRKA